MADNANGAYEPLTKLIGVMTDYANIDNTNLFSVSQAIAGLGEIGKGSYSVKSVENTINLLTRLQTLTRAGAIHFDVTGLEAFSNLSVRKASLNNLATFLPTIASVDVANLERLSHVDLTNFNNLDIKKASMNNLVQMIDAVNNMRVDTSWATDLTQSVRSMSDSIAEFSESTKSSLQGFATVLNSINDTIQNMGISKVSNEISQVGKDAQVGAIYLGRYRDSLDEVTNNKLQSSLSYLGIAEQDISSLTKRFEDMNIRVEKVTPLIKTNKDGVQELQKIMVRGVTTLGDVINHTIEIDKKTGSIGNQYTRLVATFKRLKTEVKETQESINETSLNRTVSEVENIKGQMKEIAGINRKLDSAYFKMYNALGGSGALNQNKKDLDEIKQKYIDLSDAYERLRFNQETATQEEISNVRQLQTELDGLIRKSQERLQPAKTIDFTLDTANIQASVNTVRRRLQDLQEPAKATTEAVNKLNSAFDAYQKETNSDAKKAAISDINKRIQIANKLLSEQETIQKRLGVTERKTRREAAQNANKQNRLEQEANAQKRVALDLLAKIAKAQQEWTKARNGSTSSEYAKLQTYSSQLNTLLSNFANHSMRRPEFIAQVRSLGDEFARTSSIIQSAGEDTKTLRDRFGALAGAFSMWFSTTRIIMMVYSNIRKMISASIELDASLTQLQIVTKENDEAMTKFGNSAADAARRIGSSITDFTSSVTTFARLGYSIGESSQLAEFTAMLQNVGDIDVADAQDAITSIVKAYNVGVDEIESVMDKLVVVGNNAPISVKQIAEGMTNASSALAAAGNSFEQSVALLTAANTTIQDAAKSSTGLRTITARIRKTKTELDELGETMTDADYEKLVKALTDAKVALTDNGEFRSTYDILRDIAAQWQNLTSMEQAALTEALAANRQQAIFNSIIGQFQEASGAMEAMANSSGELRESYATYMESAEAHINQLKAAFESLAQSLFNSDSIKTVVDMLAGLLTTLDNFVRTIGGVPTIITGIAAAMSAFGNVGRGKQFPLNKYADSNNSSVWIQAV